ncbi:hypothetical protein COCNU_scaffold044129G000010 [Cocos nucifera]|nr:hypothetical protein [Cocos nucifera]
MLPLGIPFPSQICCSLLFSIRYLFNLFATLNRSTAVFSSASDRSVSMDPAFLCTLSSPKISKVCVIFFPPLNSVLVIRVS